MKSHVTVIYVQMKILPIFPLMTGYHYNHLLLESWDYCHLHLSQSATFLLMHFAVMYIGYLQLY